MRTIKAEKRQNGKRKLLEGAILAGVMVCSLTACTGGLPGKEETPAIMETVQNEQTKAESTLAVPETNPPKTEKQPTETMPPITVQAETTKSTPEETTSLVSEKETSQPETDAPAKAASNPAREAYASALKDILDKQVFPGGQEFGYNGSDLATNKFAVYDIDSDGREELIILYMTTISAGMGEYIYDFDSQSGTVREQFVEYTANRYYSNGLVESDLSHNQGLAGRFWPYTVYRYDSGTDSYKRVASVDAWDKSLRETDYEGNTFPDEVDKNGDLLIYYIIPEGSTSADPVDMEEFGQWSDSLFGGAEILTIPYLPLTEENIQSIR